MLTNEINEVLKFAVLSNEDKLAKIRAIKKAADDALDMPSGD